jgi:hypothetical protein
MNCHPEMPTHCFLREGNGLDDFEFARNVIKPWEILVDLGHNASHNFDFLVKSLAEFKGLEEIEIAETLLQLAVNHSSKEDATSKLICNTFEANREGNHRPLNKEPEDKKTSSSWSLDNLSRAFRELYPILNWNKVFDSF